MRIVGFDVAAVSKKRALVRPLAITSSPDKVGRSVLNLNISALRTRSAVMMRSSHSPPKLRGVMTNRP